MRVFPDKFLWGAATAAYQIEGAAREGGRGASIWDAFSHTPGRIAAGDHGDVACDHYHRWEEDVALMKSMGLGCYRFSISWPRVLPQGGGEPNEEGLAFYDRLIDGLLANGVQPWVTLYHWDLPLALQLEEDGLLNPAVAERFVQYARLCFERFGDRVKHWITFNEPHCSAVLGHGVGVHAPGRKSDVEPYIVGHNILRAHARIVDLYRREFQDTQKGAIGITNNCDWREPLTDDPRDVEAAQRGLEFFLGWFADPVYFGRYPERMLERVGEKMPQFTDEERALLEGSSDFFGLNHYTTAMTSDPAPQRDVGLVVQRGNGGVYGDQGVTLSRDESWGVTDMGWSIVPWGCRKLLQWIDARYGRPPIYITENGCAMPGEDDRATALGDTRRIAFIEGYLGACHEAIQSGVDLRGYMYWSFMDNFEWAFGYGKRFGLHWIDYRTQERAPKASAKWYAEAIRRNGLA